MNDVMQIYDISLALTPRLARWPGDPDIALTQYQSLTAGDNSNNTHLACSVHSGTHIDAPVHFLENGTGADQIPLGVLVGQAMVVEIPNVDRITPKHLKALDLPPETRVADVQRGAAASALHEYLTDPRNTPKTMAMWEGKGRPTAMHG